MDRSPSFGLSSRGDPRIGRNRIRLPLASIGGWAAVVAAFGGLFIGLQDGGSRPLWLTLTAGAAGGGVALWRPNSLGMLAFADGFLAVAVLSTFYGFGLFFLPPLLVLVLATADTPARRRTSASHSGVATFAAGPPRRPSPFDGIVERLRHAADPESVT